MILSLLGIIITYFFISYTVSNIPEDYAERRMRNTSDDDESDGAELDTSVAMDADADPDPGDTGRLWNF